MTKKELLRKLKLNNLSGEVIIKVEGGLYMPIIDVRREGNITVIVAENIHIGEYEDESLS